MEEKIYKITLASGTIYNNLALNGNNFISKSPVDASLFEGSCSPVTINDGTDDEIHANMELVQITSPVEGEWWIVLRDLGEDELAKIKNRSDLEYMAMMCDVEL